MIATFLGAVYIDIYHVLTAAVVTQEVRVCACADVGSVADGVDVVASAAGKTWSVDVTALSCVIQQQHPLNH